MQVANKTPVTKDNEKGRENPGDVKSGGGKSPSQESDLLHQQQSKNSSCYQLFQAFFPSQL